MIDGRWMQGASLAIAVATVLTLLGLWGNRDDLRSIRTAALPFSAGGERSRSAREIEDAFRQGVEHLRQRRFNEAASAFHRVLARDPRQPEAHINMGFALYELGDFKGARSFFYSGKALDPRMGSADYGLALVLDAEGHRQQAIVRMQRYADSLAPGDPNRMIALRRLSEMTLANAAGASRDSRAAPGPITSTR